MNKNKTIEKIAKDKLGLETLEEQKMDELDFHDLSVWQIKDALKSAFQAGQKAKCEKLYYWNEINEAMMKTGYSAKQIARFLSVLTKINRGG